MAERVSYFTHERRKLFFVFFGLLVNHRLTNDLVLQITEERTWNFFVAPITNQSSLTLLIFPRIFFGLVSGNSQARSKPSKPKFLTRECAEFTNARRCSTDSSCERTFSKSRSKKRQQKLTIVLYLMLPSSPWSSFPPTDRSTLNPGNLLLRAVMWR